MKGQNLKIKFIIFLIGILIIISIFAFSSCSIFTPSANTAEQASASNNESEDITDKEQESKEAETTAIEIETTIKDSNSDQIKITKPDPNQVIESPLIIEGNARGTWYFEATFPVKLLDANGNVIASHYAQAQGEWMTEDFVPFIAQLEFKKPSTATGTLVLEKDNPSGLPENDAKVEIPIRFN